MADGNDFPNIGLTLEIGCPPGVSRKAMAAEAGEIATKFRINRVGFEHNGRWLYVMKDETPAEAIARWDGEGEHYAPWHGWTCFHCGETLTTEGAARDHFGFEPSADPACRIKAGAERGLVMALRKAEKAAADAWHAIHSEGTDAARAYYAQTERHSDQLRQMEELGYERGLADGRNSLQKTSGDVSNG